MVEALVVDQIPDLEVAEARPHVLHTTDLVVETPAGLRHFTLEETTFLLDDVGAGVLGLKFRETLFQPRSDLIDLRIATGFEALLLYRHLVTEHVRVFAAAVLVNFGDHVGGEVVDLLQVLRRQIQQVTKA